MVLSDGFLEVVPFAFAHHRPMLENPEVQKLKR